MISTTGSPLTVDAYEWVYAHVKRDLLARLDQRRHRHRLRFRRRLAVAPVTAGEIQCRCLGVAVEAFDEGGRPLVGEVGELVVTEPMPTMPLYFWNDPGGAGTTRATSRSIPASGGTATGSASPSAARR